MTVYAGDIVILNDGREALVLQAATFDTVFEYRDENGRVDWTDSSLVAWNKSEDKFVALDSDLNQDYT